MAVNNNNPLLFLGLRGRENEREKGERRGEREKRVKRPRRAGWMEADCGRMFFGQRFH